MIPRRQRPRCVYATTIRAGPAKAHVAVPSVHAGLPNSASLGGFLITGTTLERSERYSFHHPSLSLTKYNVPSGDHPG
jgi:hypothetical protein